jgi:predicted  nucleic acid-binding Zn-ribbon protein
MVSTSIITSDKNKVNNNTMNRSQSLYHLQELDTGLDHAQNRIQEINTLLQDRSILDEAIKTHQEIESIHADNSKFLKIAEGEVTLQSGKLEVNQQKLYSGIITNPKELEDLQLESNSLTKYLHVLEERQLEAMIVSDQSRSDLDAASARLDEVTRNMEKEHITLNQEKSSLESEITTLSEKKKRYLEKEDLPDLPIYQSLRASSGGIAVTIMTDSSCSSCGASIPSAIEQAAKAPAKLAFCPTCKRILHPG